MRLKLEPAAHTGQQAGLIARGAGVAALCQKLRERRAHYTALRIAMGDGWLAVYAAGPGAAPNLPWLPDRPIYLETLGGGLLCQAGFRPNVPEPLWPDLASALCPPDGDGPVALTAEGDGGRLYDLGQSIPLADADLKALGAMA